MDRTGSKIPDISRFVLYPRNRKKSPTSGNEDGLGEKWGCLKMGI